MRPTRAHKRALLAVPAALCAGAALAACGASVPYGGENAATHPASGIFVSNTVGGGGDVSNTDVPTVTYVAPGPKPPAVLPAGQQATVKAIQSSVTGGCWEDGNTGNVYGAYGQVFWWPGQCWDSVAGVTVELYPSAAAAAKSEHHPTSSALLGRYLSGAVLVDVWTSAPLAVQNAISGVKGLQELPGYGS